MRNVDLDVAVPVTTPPSVVGYGDTSESPKSDIQGVSPRFRDRETEVYRAEKALDEAAVRAAQTRFRYLALVTTSLTYHDAAPPSPSPTARVRSCPESDVFRCPGG